MKTLATLSKEDAELEARRMLRKQIADAQEKLMDNLAERIAELTEAYDNVGK